jgi:hypothetical protein
MRWSFRLFVLAVCAALSMPHRLTAFAAPAADEAPFDGAANADTDTLFDCYWHEVASDPRFKAGPPRLVRTPEGLQLHADYWGPRGHGQLMCALTTARMENGVDDVQPGSPDIASPGAASRRAFTDWTARRLAEEHRLSGVGQRPAPDADTAAYLEGLWLVGADPGGVTCLATASRGTELEFEFARSGGRLLVFEPTDLFTPVQIAGITRNGALVTVQGRGRDGRLKDIMTLKIVDDRHFQSVPAPGRFPRRAAEIAARCGVPDRGVTAGVSTAQLAALSPPISGGWGYPEAIDGVDDADVCAGKAAAGPPAIDRASLQFELYGPVHYWIFGMNVRRGKHMAIYEYVRSVRAVDDRVLKLTMQTHLEAGAGWDVPESRGEIYEITVIDSGSRIEIPEFHKIFIRCDPAQSPGMHRL